MDLPVPTSLKPMLSKLQDELPRGEGWLYEPKWDGFRALVFRDRDEIEVISRDGRDLKRYFPELLPPLCDTLPLRCVIDGEVVIASNGVLDFDALLLRIHPAASRIEKLSRETPASFVAFDCIALGDEDLRNHPFTQRRARLAAELGAPEKLLPRSKASQVLLTPQTLEHDDAEAWFDALEKVGLDGVIAKRHDLRYCPGDRVMVKVKQLRTADCVVGGFRLSKSQDGIGSLLLGLYDDEGVLHYVGHTSSFKAAERRELLAELRRLEGDSFGAGRAPGGPSRWRREQEAAWVSVRPERVCEVSFDKMQGDRFRHAARFLRWRPDRKPRSCTFDQLPRR